jgi:hypothetical protein
LDGIVAATEFAGLRASKIAAGKGGNLGFIPALHGVKDGLE